MGHFLMDDTAQVKDRDALKEACEAVVSDPNLKPKPDGTTFCNVAVQAVAGALGYHEFSDKMANQIYDIMLKSDDWMETDAPSASKWADDGGLAVAGQKGKPHGHVAVVYGGGMVYSGKWSKDCAVLANVGERCGLFGANWCFKDEPDYFILK